MHTGYSVHLDEWLSSQKISVWIFSCIDNKHLQLGFWRTKNTLWSVEYKNGLFFALLMPVDISFPSSLFLYVSCWDREFYGKLNSSSSSASNSEYGMRHTGTRSIRKKRK